jgi:hypothetical protein
VELQDIVLHWVNPKADILKLVNAWLERKDQRQWLMIIDNADDTEMFFNSSEATSPKPEDTNQLALEGNLGHYIPECSHGSILVTTRNKHTGVRLTRGRGGVNNDLGCIEQERTISVGVKLGFYIFAIWILPTNP